MAGDYSAMPFDPFEVLRTESIGTRSEFSMQ
jgi:hypothetical protein